MNNTSPSVRKPLDQIQYHPNIMFWGGTLTITLDHLNPTTEQSVESLTLLATALIDYSPWAYRIKLAVRPAIPDKFPDSVYASHIADLIFIIEVINKLEKVRELRMTILVQKWDFAQLKFGAALYGLENVNLKWTLAYRIMGREGEVEIEEDNYLMKQLVRVFKEEFGGSPPDHAVEG